MKALTLLLALATAPALAQTTPPAPRNPTPAQAKAIKERTAERRAERYQGPKVVKNSKQLGREFIQDSKPTQDVKIVPVK